MEEVDKGCSEFPCNGPCCLSESFFFFLRQAGRQADRQADRETDRETDRQTDRQTELTDRQTDRHEAKQWNKVTMTVYTTTV